MKNNLIILLFLLFILAGSFTAGILILMSDTKEEAAKTTLEQTKEYYAEKVLTQPNEPDWYITYGMPTCRIPQEGESTTLGGTRIHWLKVEEGEVEATQMADDTKIIFTGTINGNHLIMTDNEFGNPSMIKPFKITAEFDGTLTEFNGTYTAQYKIVGVPYLGCPADGTVTGPVSAKPME